MKVKIAELQSLVEKVAQSIIDLESAKYLAEKIISTHLRKDKRINAVKDFLEDVEKFKKSKTKQIKLVKKSKNSRIYDLNKLPGLPFLKQINDELVSLAREYGISAIGLRNSGGIHTLDTWVLGLTDQDCIGIFTWNGGPYCVVPYGGRKPFWGTNPLAYAIPTEDKPIILDMATSEIPFMNWRIANKKNKRLPPNSAVDKEGNLTTDPKKVFEDPSCGGLITMGTGYKGSNITLLVEIITGALVGAKMGRETKIDPIDWSEFGGLLICLDIASFTDVQAFKYSVTQMRDQIRKSKPQKGFDKVRLPGDRGYERMEKTLKLGEVELEKEVIEKLRLLASI